MNRHRRLGTMLGLLAAAAGAAVATPAVADAAPRASYRQLLGDVRATTYLEASTPAAGTYRIEYDITGVAYFDTYLDGAELGYAGGATGVYLTRTVRLTAGGHLVEVVGPEGSGTARVYLVRAA